MVDILLGMLAKERPTVSSVIDCSQVSHRDLHMCEIRYVQDAKYHIATSYYTATWLAPSPTGPMYNGDGTLKMDCLGDIATLSHYDSVKELKRQARPTVGSLVKIMDSLDEAAKQYVSTNYPCLKDVLYNVSFSFNPIPIIQVCLARGDSIKRMLGTITITTGGDVQITSRATYEVDELVASMQCVPALPIFKESNYVKDC